MNWLWNSGDSQEVKREDLYRMKQYLRCSLLIQLLMTGVFFVREHYFGGSCFLYDFAAIVIMFLIPDGYKKIQNLLRIVMVILGVFLVFEGLSHPEWAPNLGWFYMTLVLGGMIILLFQSKPEEDPITKLAKMDISETTDHNLSSRS